MNLYMFDFHIDIEMNGETVAGRSSDMIWGETIEEAEETLKAKLADAHADIIIDHVEPCPDEMLPLFADIFPKPGEEDDDDDDTDEPPLSAWTKAILGP